jgi:MoaA/NifB/PqqE/SkfB family radical SAM enzyme
MFFKKKDKSPIDKAIESYNKTRSKTCREHICYAPYTSMRFASDGKVYACCHNRSFVLGTYPAENIKNIWFGSKTKELRTTIENNMLSAGCHICYNSILNGFYYGASARDYDDAVSSNSYPTRMEFAISNLCNFECIMCYPENSSKVAHSTEGCSGQTHSYPASFTDDLAPFIPHLKQSIFTGGEPFLIKQYALIWDKIIATNPACRIFIQTNGSIMNDFIKNLFKNPQVHISVSIDALSKSTFENIRKGSSFDIVMKNFDILHNISKEYGSTLSVSVCPLKQNFAELPSLFEHFNNKHIPLTIHKVSMPPENSIKSLCARALNEGLIAINAASFVKKTLIQKENVRKISAFAVYVAHIVDAQKLTDSRSTKAETPSLDVVIARLSEFYKYSGVATDAALEATNSLRSLIESFEAPVEQNAIIKTLLNIEPGYIATALKNESFDKQRSLLKQFSCIR